jgi:hypothetical protein
MEYLIGLVGLLAGGVFYLFSQNQKLKSDKKLADSKIEDAKLETKQDALVEKSNSIQNEISNVKQTEVNPAQSAEDFWKDRK